ncbi:MAG: hypothetical protein Unbinned5784contig1000_1 [Prokaryotic dsDNA virus sp.]|nr:MAG: hypothetical protein Unbinned5784contig1000_1 [Prokaryotic dsDNA virus sp.]|tara:strand:+ start:606 stop:1079 length:474 start_codon:yes stop_codon:yes gene_type:complete
MTKLSNSTPRFIDAPHLGDRAKYLWTLLCRIPVEDAIFVLEGYTNDVNEDRILDGDRPYAPQELLEYGFDMMSDNHGDMTAAEAATDLEEKIADARAIEIRNHAISYIDQLHFLLSDRLEGIDPDEELDDWREMAEIVAKSKQALDAFAGISPKDAS